jgi:HSP20 family protein
MKIVPWRTSESKLPATFDIDDLWKSLWQNGDGELAIRLPELFRARRPFPAINIAETEDGFSITMDCPGMEEKDFQIARMGNQLVISGERRWEQEKKGKEFRQVESQYGRFERTVELPVNARTDPEGIEARYKRGVLTISVPKIERTPASKIPVHAG